MAFFTAVLVSKAPTPFVEKGVLRTDEHEQRELVLNQNWDPNAPLASRSQALSMPPLPQTKASAVTHLDVEPGDADSLAGEAGSEERDFDPYIYWVQTSSYSDRADAMAMRARIVATGFSAQIVERLVNGLNWHQVRVGPLSSRSEAEDLKISLDSAGCKCTLVRVEQ